MKTSTSIATFLIAGAGAASVGANVPNPFQGSDTLFNVTTNAITAAGLGVDAGALPYVGGGSGNGQSAMVSNTIQHIAPMSRMINSGNNVCTFAGGRDNASGIVIALDAVDVLASAATGASAACNSAGNGLAFNSATNGFTDYRMVLALIYGGKDYTVAGAPVDCNSAKRNAIVNAWSNVFQNNCANSEPTCADAAHNGVTGQPAKLWHAYRRDDASGTADVFAGVLGITPNTSASALNGFGNSPYCNALNWDVTTPNANCVLGVGKQFTGPGGVAQGFCSVTTATACVIGSTNPAQGCPAGETCLPDAGGHKRPPLGTWGDDPDPAAGAIGAERGADVLPTSFQDNDPIRRPCIGTITNNLARAGEEVCNINGTLGLVVPVPATDFIAQIDDPTHPGLKLKQYPVNNCGGTFLAGVPALVFTCAARNNKHSAQCANGDSLPTNKCQVPVDAPNNTSQCVATKATVPALKNRLPAVPPDGRAFNLQMRDGSMVDANIKYVQERIPTATTAILLDFAAAYSRNHQVQTIPAGTVAAPSIGCQLADASDQIGCFVHADRCSIGFAGDGANNWGDRRPGGVVPSDNGALLVSTVAPNLTTVQLLGQAGEYPLARKLYLNSLIGFGAATVTADELSLAKFEAVDANIAPIVIGDGFFPLGANSPGGVAPSGRGNPFCEDFNQELVCGAAQPNTTNACNGNLAIPGGGIPGDPSATPASSTTSTVCGNGKVEVYEECDPTAPPATWHCSVTGAACSSSCRC